MSVKFQHGEESLLRHFHVANLLHSLLSALLLLEQFALTRHVAAIAFGRNVLAHLAHRFAGNDLGADGSLHGDLKHLARDVFLELLGNL